MRGDEREIWQGWQSRQLSEFKKAFVSHIAEWLHKSDATGFVGLLTPSALAKDQKDTRTTFWSNHLRTYPKWHERLHQCLSVEAKRTFPLGS